MYSNESIRTRYASRILREAVTRKHSTIPQGDHRRFPDEPADDDRLPPWHISKADTARKAPQFSGKVCIVGAGVAGLYLARELDRWNIPYDLLESSDGVGGRVYTHFFKETDPHIAHNYYDVGAMRFPNLQTMAPVFELFHDLNLELKPYQLSYERVPNLFSNTSISAAHIDTILEPLSDAIGPYVEALTKDFDTGFEKLLKEDAYSTREFLRVRRGMTFNEVTQLETFETSTGLFDQAFTETVLDNFDFTAADAWFRIDGGTSKLTDTMHEQLRCKAQLKKRVTAIGQQEEDKILVTVSDENQPREYSAVFNTTTLGCLGQMDLSQLPLSDQQQTAIRALSYDRSCKVGIKFARPWWDDYGVDLGAGGSSATDLPIRTTVYPSWNDGTDKPAVLICSYTWAQDATRFSALIVEMGAEDALYELVLRNLVRLFKGRPPSRPGVPPLTFELLKNLVLERHAYSWAQDPNTVGAFALFGPGQFTNLYPAMKEPAADGRFYMVGEGVSEHHAWIIGSLQSVKEAFKMFLIRFDLVEPLVWLEEHSYGPAEPAKSELNVLYWLVQHATSKPLEIGKRIRSG